MYFTPGQVSEMLGIPESTLRRYAVIFADQLSSQDGRKHRAYTSSDVLIFRQVRDLSASNLQLSDIPGRLAIVNDTGQDKESKPSALALVPDIAADLEEARQIARSAIAQVAVLNQLVEQQTATIDNLQKRLDEISGQFSNFLRTMRGIATDREHELRDAAKVKQRLQEITSLEFRIDKLEDYSSRPWWKRLF